MSSINPRARIGGAVVLALLTAGLEGCRSRPKSTRDPLSDADLIAAKPAGTNAIIVRAFGPGSIRITGAQQTCVDPNEEDWSPRFPSWVCWAYVPVATPTVNVTGVASEGVSRFAAWTAGPCPSSPETCAVPMTTDRVLAARFDYARPAARTEFSIRADVTGFVDGEIAAAAAPAPPAGFAWGCSVYDPDTYVRVRRSCSATVPAGTTVTLTATPPAGARFVGWEGPCSGTGRCTLVVDRDLGVGATFALSRVERPTVAVSPAAGPAGTVFMQSGSGFTPGAAVTLLFERPDLTQATASTTADASGSFAWPYDSSRATQPGYHRFWAVDTSSGLSSGAVTFQITSSRIATIDAVAFESTTLPIDSAVNYVATLHNWTTADLTALGLQGWIEQGATRRAAGGAVATCGAGDGVLPPGTCADPWLLVADNRSAGSGTLVPGSATAVIELLRETLTTPQEVLDTFRTPITLTAVVPHSISGVVSGAAAAGVAVTLSGTASAAATTDASGAFAFQNLGAGTYALTPSLAGYTFSPSSLTVRLFGADVGGQGFVSSRTPTFALGTPTALSSIPNGLCWFTTPMHAVFTNAAGTTWIASAEHRYCDTHVDSVAIYSRPTGGAWSSARPLTYAYAAGSVDQSWFNGMPGVLSMAQSSSGEPHVLVNIRKPYGSTGWGPDRSTYLRRSAGSWLVTADVASDEALQIAEGNPNGAQYSGYPFSLVAAPNTDVLHLFGYDAAWWATRYHAIGSSAAAGSATWSAMTSAYTSTGAVDRGAVLGASQDIRGAAGVQAWLDAPSCSILGRRLSGDAWSAPSINVPLGFASCSTSPNAYWGINMSSETLVSSAGVPTLLAAGQPRVSGSPVVLARITPNGSSWTRISTVIPTWTVASDGFWRAFDDAAGRQYIVHAGATAGTIMIYDIASGQDSLLYAGATGSSIGFVDAERHGPRVIVWAESSGSTWSLKVADLIMP